MCREKEYHCISCHEKVWMTGITPQRIHAKRLTGDIIRNTILNLWDRHAV